MAITFIDSLEHVVVTSVFYSAICKIDENHFILAYTGPGSDGYVKIFSIDPISDNITELSSLEHQTSDGTYNSIILLDSSHFIVCYRDSNYTQLTSFSFNSSYQITEISSTMPTGLINNISWSELVKIDDTHFALVSTHSYINAYEIYTNIFSVDGSYAITKTGQTFTAQGSSMLYRPVSVGLLDSSHLIIAHTGTDGDGFIRIYSFNGSYGGLTQTGSLEFDTSSGVYVSLVVIDSTHFVVAYQNTDSTDGIIKTFSTNGSYTTISEVNSLTHDSSGATYNSLVKLDDTNFALAYTNSSGFGVLKTFSIDESYTITETASFQHDSVAASYNDLAVINSGHVILAYTGESNHGYLKTFIVNTSQGYKIYRSIDGGAYLHLANTDLSTFSYTDITTDYINHDYSYKIIRFINQNLSGYTNIIALDAEYKSAPIIRSSASMVKPMVPRSIIITQTTSQSLATFINPAFKNMEIAATIGNSTATKIIPINILATKNVFVTKTVSGDITFIDHGVFGSASYGGSPVVPMPTTYAENDLLILMVHTEGVAIATPDGWTIATGSPKSYGLDGTGIRLSIFYKFASASESDVTLPASTYHTTGIISSYRGVILSSPINAGDGAAGLTLSNYTSPAITTTIDKCMIVITAAMGYDSNVTDYIASSYSNINLISLTKRHDQGINIANGGGIAFITGIKTAAGNTGITDLVAIPNGYNTARITVGLAPELIPGGAQITSNAAMVAPTITISIDKQINQTIAQSLATFNSPSLVFSKAIIQENCAQTSASSLNPIILTLKTIEHTTGISSATLCEPTIITSSSCTVISNIINSNATMLSPELIIFTGGTLILVNSSSSLATMVNSEVFREQNKSIEIVNIESTASFISPIISQMKDALIDISIATSNSIVINAIIFTVRNILVDIPIATSTSNFIVPTIIISVKIPIATTATNVLSPTITTTNNKSINVNTIVSTATFINPTINISIATYLLDRYKIEHYLLSHYSISHKII